MLYELATRSMLVDKDYVLGKEIAKNPNFLRPFLEDIPACYSKSLKNIIKRLLNIAPKKRLRAEDLLKKNKVKRFHQLSPYKLAKEKSELVLECN